MTVENDSRNRGTLDPVQFAPAREPVPIGTYAPSPTSSGSIELISGYSALSVSSCCGSTIPDTDSRVQLQLDPDRPVVIGRQENGIPPYLDPAYQSTRLVPGSEQPVVQSSTEGRDTYVSRAHFMLRGNAHGIVLTNGVPRAGGGIRLPTNWTYMREPQCRVMEPGEEYLIEHGAAVLLQLPNHNILRICAA